MSIFFQHNYCNYVAPHDTCVTFYTYTHKKLVLEKVIFSIIFDFYYSKITLPHCEQKPHADLKVITISCDIECFEAENFYPGKMPQPERLKTTNTMGLYTFSC